MHIRILVKYGASFRQNPVYFVSKFPEILWKILRAFRINCPAFIHGCGKSKHLPVPYIFRVLSVKTVPLKYLTVIE